MYSLLIPLAILVQAVPKTRSYVDNGDGTITDVVTGLMWEKYMEAMTWYNAQTFANEATTGGYTDWRLPSVKELFSLILFTGSCSGDYSIKLFIDYDYFDQPLGNTSLGEREIDAQTWSSSDYDGDTMGNTVDTVFGVNFVDGRVKAYPKVKKKYVRLVRGNEEYAVNIFTNNGDGTVSDNATGLMWAESDNGEGLDWENALAYAESSTLSGYSDWRLPTIKELNSIVDYSKSQYEAFIDETYFNITQTTDPLGGSWYAFFWSSTTLLEGPGDRANYQTFGRSLGNFSGELIDAHGAGAIRADPKSGNAEDYPKYYQGYQGDLQYVYNFVRIVRDTSESDTDLTYPIVETNISICYNDWNEIDCPASDESYYGQDGNYASVMYPASDAPTLVPTSFPTTTESPTTTASPTEEVVTNSPTSIPTSRPNSDPTAPTRSPTTAPTSLTEESAATGILEQPALYIALVVVICLLFVVCFICRARICGIKGSTTTHKAIPTPRSQAELQQKNPGSHGYQPQTDRRGYNEGRQVEGRQNFGVSEGRTNVSQTVAEHENRWQLGEPVGASTNSAAWSMEITRV